MSKQQGYHPNIGSIIRLRDQNYEALYVNRDYEKSILQMIGIIMLLKPEDQEPVKDLLKSLENEYGYYTTSRSSKKISLRKRERRSVYHVWFRELNKTLWDKGYLENAKYEPFKLDDDEVDFK